jgi:hypothetical protein
MDEMTRRRLEMGRRALAFCRAHPDTNPAYLALVARLERLIARANELEIQEQIERRLARGERTSGPNGKVIPFPKPLEKPTNGDPTEPAA